MQTLYKIGNATRLDTERKKKQYEAAHMLLTLNQKVSLFATIIKTKIPIYRTTIRKAQLYTGNKGKNFFKNAFLFFSFFYGFRG